jgi:hypothetical protein
MTRELQQLELGLLKSHATDLTNWSGTKPSLHKVRLHLSFSLTQPLNRATQFFDLGVLETLAIAGQSCL